MKKIFSISTLLVAALVLTLVSCKPKEASIVVQSVLLDTTDSLTALPDGARLKEVFAFQDDLWNTEAHFRLRTIDQIVVSGVQEFEVLPQRNTLLSNKLERINEVNIFYHAIDQSIAQVASDTATRKKSSVYATIVHELELLSKTEANVKKLYIFSNLLENQPGFLSLYDLDTKAELEKHPDKILKKFVAYKTLPDLSDIEIEIIHNPGDSYAEAKVFQQMADVYQALFELYNVKSITIKTNH